MVLPAAATLASVHKPGRHLMVVVPLSTTLAFFSLPDDC